MAGKPNTFLSRQCKAPILEALRGYSGVTRFHMPGHRGGRAAESLVKTLLGAKMFRQDVTGVLGMDDLQEPKGCIQEAQELAAEAFGADKTYFSVNGTSGAIQAMVMACVGEGDSLIIPRNVHKSVLSAIILSGARPVFALPAYEPGLGFATGVTAEELNRRLHENPETRAALLVNPTYYGTATDLTEIAASLHQKNAALLVDEAHGPHFGFHPELPKPSLLAGADGAAQGAHKMLSALTQASMLHVKGERIDRARLGACFRRLCTTSPSYLLLSSLDAARRQMALDGRTLLAKALDLSCRLRDEIKGIPGLSTFGPEKAGRPGFDALDPTKVTVKVSGLGITGYQAEEYLRRKRGIQMEMSDLHNVLAIVSYGNSLRDIRRLTAGLRALVASVTSGEMVRNLLPEESSVPQPPPLPKMALTPKQAVSAPYEKVSLSRAEGRVSAEVITCYPPGIPILYPGEVVTYDTVGYLEIVRSLSFGVSGPEDSALGVLRVVTDI